MNPNIDEKRDARIVAKNLKRLLYKREKTQADLIRDLGFKQSTVSSWMTGERLPRMDKVDLLCKYLNCSRMELIDEYTGSSKAYDAIKVPILGKVAAGQPIEMIEDVLGDVVIEPHKGSEYFALEIKGDSMYPRMESGDVVIVRKQECVESGEIAVVAVNGDEATCKKIRIFHDGIEIVPINPSYKSVFYTNEEVQTLPVTIIGKVVELRAKFE